VPRVIDTGASWSVAPCIQAFVSEIKELCETLQTLDGTINVSGSDFVEWNIQDRDGIQKTIRNRALYVPAPGERLFSPRTYFHENKGGSLLCKPNGLILTLPDGSTLSLLWQPTSNLPCMLTTKLFEEVKRHKKEAHHIKFDRSAFAVSTLPNVLDTANHNLNYSQRSSFFGIKVWGTPRPAPICPPKR
jgi:hypothetical protein